MKKFLFIITTVLAASALFSSCQQQEEGKGEQQLRHIRFTASVGAYASKATDTSFEIGDAVGVFAKGTTSFTNERLVWDGTSLIPDQELYWSPDQGQEEPSSFLAYYPYMQNQGDGGFSFSVQYDQSTQAAFTASDFMTADAEATPADAGVNLVFGHRMAKIVLRIENHLESEIARVLMDNVYTAVEGVVGENIRTVPEPGTVNAGKVTLSDGSVAWALIVAPGTVTPQLLVYTADGKEYSYDIPEGIQLIPGHRYNGQVVLDQDSMEVEFSAGVNDWFNDGGFNFDNDNRPVGGEWSVIGTFEGYSWTTDFWMEKVSQKDPELWQIVILYYTGEEFKFRANGGWDANYGAGEWSEVDGALRSSLVWYGPNIMLPEDGYWELSLDLTAQTLTAVKVGDVPPMAIRIDGDFSDWEQLDPEKVSEAICASDAAFHTLHRMKAYADKDALYIYFEYDESQLSLYYSDYVSDWVPFHIVLDADGNPDTGGDLLSQWVNPGIDFILESFLYARGDLLYDEGGLFRFIGDDGSSEWNLSYWDSGVSRGRGDHYAYEVCLKLSSLPHLAQKFFVGIDIRDNAWDALGYLPNADVSEDNPKGRAALLPVVTDRITK